MSPRGVRHVATCLAASWRSPDVRGWKDSFPQPSTPGRSCAPTARASGTAPRDSPRSARPSWATRGWHPSSRRFGCRPASSKASSSRRIASGWSSIPRSGAGRRGARWTRVQLDARPAKAATMIARAVRVVLGVLALLVAPVTQADLRDLGTYGPTCPVPASPITTLRRASPDRPPTRACGGSRGGRDAGRAESTRLCGAGPLAGRRTAGRRVRRP